MTISKRLRFEILRRDNHTCRYCGAAAPDVKLEVDHVVPVALGGTDAPENLAASCQACNNGKGATAPDAPIVAEVQEAAGRLETAKRDARKPSMYHGYADEIGWFYEDWNQWRDSAGDTIPGPDNASIRVWLLRGFGIEQICELIPVAMKKDGVELEDRWRYFCGCVWRQIKSQEERTWKLYSGGGCGVCGSAGRSMFTAPGVDGAPMSVCLDCLDALRDDYEGANEGSHALWGAA